MNVAVRKLRANSNYEKMKSIEAPSPESQNCFKMCLVPSVPPEKLPLDVLLGEHLSEGSN